MNFAIIKGGVVETIIVADQDFIDNNYPDAINITGLEHSPGIGWSYSDNVFTPPVAPVVKPEFFVHIKYDDTLNESPPGLKNDGVDSVTITLTIRAGVETTSAVVPVTAKFMLVFRTENETQFGIIKLQFTDGVGSFNYSTTGQTATVHLSQSDLALLVPDAKITIVGENTLIIYEDHT